MSNDSAHSSAPPRNRIASNSRKLLGASTWLLAADELIGQLKISDVVEELEYLAARLESMPKERFVTAQEYAFHSIAKKSGGMRKIQAPSEWLKRLQRALYLAISNLVAPHPLSHGFEKGRSIVTNAACHSYQPVVVRLDIRNAFNSTKKAFVIAALERDLEFLKLSARAFALLGEIFTLHDALPTGAPSSPFLLNRILFPVDCSIGDLAHFRDVKYSRYADDIVLSGVRATSLKHDVLKALKKLGYQLNEKKSRISRSGGRQMVTGLVVNSSPNLPREIRRNLRAATHSWARKGQATWKGDHLSEAQLIGHLSHYLMIDARSALALRNEIKI